MVKKSKRKRFNKSPVPTNRADTTNTPKVDGKDSAETKNADADESTAKTDSKPESAKTGSPPQKKTKLANAAKSSPPLPTIPDKEKIVIIQPSSLYLRIGLATQDQPIEILHAIACLRLAKQTRKPKTNGAATPGVKNETERVANPGVKNETEKVATPRVKNETERVATPGVKNETKEVATPGMKDEDLISEVENILRGRRQLVEVSAGVKRRLTNQRLTVKEKYPAFQGPHYDITNSITPLPGGAAQQMWTDTKQWPRTLFHSDILHLHPEDLSMYDIKFPLHQGYLRGRRNFAARPTALTNVEKIWRHALTTLGISSVGGKYPEHSLVIIIPDIFHKRDVKDIVHVCLNNMGFANAMCLQESVSVSFGTGVSSGCMVNLGHDCTTIACVQDASVVMGTSVHLPVGGRHVEQTLLSLLEMAPDHFPCKLDLGDIAHRQIIRRIKEEHCSFYQDLKEVVKCVSFDLFPKKRETTEAKRLRFNLADEAVLAPNMTYFFPEYLFRRNILRSADVARDMIAFKTAKGLFGNGIPFDDTEDCFDSVFFDCTLKKFSSVRTSALMDAHDETAGLIKCAKCKSGHRSVRECRLELKHKSPPWNAVSAKPVKATLADSNEGTDSDSPAEKETEEDDTDNSATKQTRKKKKAKKAKRVRYRGGGLNWDETRLAAALKRHIPGQPLCSVAWMKQSATEGEVRPMPLDDAILWSVGRHTVTDKRTKLLSNIILSGGSAKIRNLVDVLEFRLRQKCAKGTTIHCLLDDKSENVKNSGWKGASIAAQSESAASFWIGRNKWCGHPKKPYKMPDKVLALRAHLPFEW